MRKATIIILILVLIGIIVGAYFYYKNYYPYSGNAGEITQEDLKCGWYYGDYNQKKIGTPDDWTHGLAGTLSASWGAPGQGIDWSCFYEDEQLIGGCAGVYQAYWQECCDNWAGENNISHIQCIGNWTIEDNQCAWKCSSG